MRTQRVCPAKYSALSLGLAFLFFASIGHAQEMTSVAVRSNIGNPCVVSSQCGKGSHCLSQRETRKGAKFVGGYCVKFDCSLANPCDVGAKCVEPEGTNFSICFARCSSDTHCRNGYACHEDGVCLPATK